MTVMPSKGLASAALKATQSRFSKYALSTISKNIIPYFDLGVFFGSTESCVDLEILNRMEEPFWDDLFDLPSILDPDFSVSERIESGKIFRIGHLLSEDNFYKILESREDDDFDTDILRLHAKSCPQYFESIFNKFLDRNPSFGSLDELAEMPLKDFYSRVYYPAFKNNLDKLMSGLSDTDEETFELYTNFMRYMPQRYFGWLKTHYPEYELQLDKIQKICRQLSECEADHTIGLVRVEKQSIGRYIFSSPQIL